MNSLLLNENNFIIITNPIKVLNVDNLINRIPDFSEIENGEKLVYLLNFFSDRGNYGYIKNYIVINLNCVPFSIPKHKRVSVNMIINKYLHYFSTNPHIFQKSIRLREKTFIKFLKKTGENHIINNNFHDINYLIEFLIDRFTSNFNQNFNRKTWYNNYSIENKTFWKLYLKKNNLLIK